MRRIQWVVAGAALIAAPAWAQHTGSTAVAAHRTPTDATPAGAPHKPQSAIGQALAGLLDEASRAQPAAHDGIAPAPPAVRTSDADVDTRPVEQPTAVDQVAAVH